MGKEVVSLEGRHALLVPYMREHVATYHLWMQDPYLLEVTGSEPLTLEEEYAMQLSWALDPHKFTFIVLDKERIRGEFFHGDPQVEAMAGDVNLYMNDLDELTTAEIEIMIAEQECRGKGLGKESVQLMMAYAIAQLNVRKFLAKIGDSNKSSLQLFRSLGFRDVCHSHVFSQITLEFITDETAYNRLKAALGEFMVHKFNA